MYERILTVLDATPNAQAVLAQSLYLARLAEVSVMCCTSIPCVQCMPLCPSSLRRWRVCRCSACRPQTWLSALRPN
ncbi:MAG: hypothetical protein JWM45_599, partial [Pseudonocardiales bacterium]|nr:hypothetical protein [Pseudonocardiales bacterium]